MKLQIKIGLIAFGLLVASFAMVAAKVSQVLAARPPAPAGWFELSEDGSMAKLCEVHGITLRDVVEVRRVGHRLTKKERWGLFLHGLKARRLSYDIPGFSQEEAFIVRSFGPGTAEEMLPGMMVKAGTFFTISTGIPFKKAGGTIDDEDTYQSFFKATPEACAAFLGTDVASFPPVKRFLIANSGAGTMSNGTENLRLEVNDPIRWIQQAEILLDRNKNLRRKLDPDGNKLMEWVEETDDVELSISHDHHSISLTEWFPD